MSPTWQTSCPDWEARLRAGESIIPPPIFPEYAERAVEIFKGLRIADADATFGECSAEWVFDVVRSIFGAYNEDTGERLISEWFILIPKKNSKSTLAAGIMMTALILNWRDSAEFNILAPTVEVANNSFGPARDMCTEKASPELATLLHTQTHVKTINHLTTQAFLKVVAADSGAVGGKKSVGVLLDELWLFGKMPDAEHMLVEATGGLTSRPEGFVIYLTTQSDEPPAGVFAKKLSYARRVRDGEIDDPKFQPIIYELPEKTQAALREKQATEALASLTMQDLRMVNPNFGYSVNRGRIEHLMQQARENGDSDIRGFLAKHANVQISMNLAGDRWAGVEHWEKNAQKLTIEQLLERSEVVTMGIDGGGLDDLLAVTVLGRDKKTKEWLHWCHAWCHEGVLRRYPGEVSKLRGFEADGDLTIYKATETGRDVTEVCDVVEKCEESGLLDQIGVDQAGIAAIAEGIQGRDIELERIIGIPQGWKLMGAIQATERHLSAGKLKHGGRALMSWAVGNAKVEPRGNAIMVTKQISGRAKIDPLMSLFDAVALMAMNPKPRAKLYQMMFLGGD